MAANLSSTFGAMDYRNFVIAILPSADMLQ